MKISLVVTLLNEEKNLLSFLDSLAQQTRLPDEIVFVDGGSCDRTAPIIAKFQNLINPEFLSIQLHVAEGNRSQGRNLGVAQASHPWIAFTDAGCVVDRNWLAELVKPVEERSRQGSYATAQLQKIVVAGYYRGLATNAFEQAVVPYVLVMPDRVDAHHFLPASRSMLIAKSFFERVGGFKESLEVSEDYDLAHRLVAAQAEILFTNGAIVKWRPKENLRQFLHMVFSMARDDVRANLTRRKVWLIWGRYLLVGVLILWLGFWTHLNYLLAGVAVYSLWAIYKNLQYAPRGWYWLPVLQIGSDLAVMAGTTVGYVMKLMKLIRK